MNETHNPHLTPALIARVAARNRVNHEVKCLAEPLFSAIAPFFGVKILKVDGSFTAAFVKAMEKFRGPDSYFNRSTYSLSMVFRACVTDSTGISQQETASLYLADMDNGVLRPGGYRDQYKLENYRSNYNAAEIAAVRAEVREAEKALDELKRDLCGFDMRDR